MSNEFCVGEKLQQILNEGWSGMKNRRKIVLIGAGSAVFTQGLVADFIMQKDFGQWEIALVDIDRAALDSIALLAKRMVDTKKSDIVITSHLDRREALPGADVVVVTIAVGGRRSWEDDVFIPRKYGIYQPVGDTTMPGGISRALRMIPPMLDIAKDVAELCPDALFFNYSNPMTAICMAIRQELGVPVIGLCHGVFHVERYLAEFIGADLSKVRSIGAGLNHLTFLYKLTVDGEDAWPKVNEELNRQKSETSRTSEFNVFAEMGENNHGRPHIWDNPFSWSIYERYGAFPAVLDRHVVEFFPERFGSGAYYGKVLGKDAFSFEAVIEYGDRVYENMHKQAAGELPLNERLFERAEGEHEQLIEILKSIYRDERKVFSVNLPNRGAVPILPEHAVLEMPAVAAAGGFYPLVLEDFPELPASILRRRISVVDLTVKAALTGSRELFIEALLADGSVKNEEDAAKLADDLLDAHREHLPQFSR
jgi:alpha-galactosidase